MNYKEKILGWINARFSLTISSEGNFINVDKIEEIARSLLSEEDLEEIFLVIKNYIKSHQSEFELGESIHVNLVEYEAKKEGSRPWYSPIVPPESPRMSAALSLMASESIQGWKIAQTRKINHNSGNFLLPNSFSEEKWEELRLLLPNACQAAGCVDYLEFNHMNPGLWDETGYKIEGGYCPFHIRYPNYYKDRDWITGLTPSRPISNSDSSSPTPTTTLDLTFVVKERISLGGIPLKGAEKNYLLKLADNGITVLGHQIKKIRLSSLQILRIQYPFLKEGSRVVIRDVDFGPKFSTIDPNTKTVIIKNHFRTIEKASTSTEQETNQLTLLRQQAIREIENELTKHNFPLSGWGVWNDTSWQTSSIYFTISPEQIQVDKSWFINRIYRKVAVNSIKKALAAKSLSVTILGLSENNLVQHFQRFLGKSNIDAEETRLINFLNSHRPDRSAEINTAIAEIQAELRKAWIDSAEELKILGNSWETDFSSSYRYATKEEITNQKQSLLTIIDKHLARKASTNQKIIAEIKKMLQESGLPESILGKNWQTKFSGKNQDEQETIKNHLIKLIYRAINQITDLSEEEKTTKKKQLLISSITSTKSSIQNKLTGTHTKLAVSETEIPTSILSPYQNIEQKLNSCQSVDEVGILENQLSIAIDQQRETKLSAIQQGAIEQIKTELKKGGELGLNENFATIIKGMVDPDQIESKKNLILNLLAEQRKQNQEENQNPENSSLNSEVSTFPIWPFVLGSILVVLFVGILIFHRLRRK